VPTRQSGSSLRLQGRPSVPRRRAIFEGFIPAPAGVTSAERIWVEGCSRFIPALAGVTCSSPGTRCCALVQHCTYRGESAISSAISGSSGSSLRLQGRLVQVLHELVEVGFIPAPAGVTTSTPGRGITGRAHPCTCRGNAKRLPSL